MVVFATSLQIIHPQQQQQQKQEAKSAKMKIMKILCMIEFQF